VDVDQLGHLDGLLVVGIMFWVNVTSASLGASVPGALPWSSLVISALVAGGQQHSGEQREQAPSHWIGPLLCLS